MSLFPAPRMVKRLRPVAGWRIGLPGIRPCVSCRVTPTPSPADVVLMYINPLGIDGVECVRLLKTEMPATQFIMLTVC